MRISIDTSKAAVAAAALDAGADYVNDVTALRGDPDMAALVAERDVDVCLMHMLGTPRTMQAEARYDDVVAEVRAFLSERIEAAVAAGIALERIEVDPGIGFAKNARPQPRGAAPAATSSGRSAARSSSAPRASRSSARITGRETAERMPRRSPRSSWATSAGPRSSASTTSPRRATPSPWRLLRCCARMAPTTKPRTTTTRT